jgi:Tfp pilus assembly protein PilE
MIVNSRSRKSGFTFVERLVATAVVGMLVELLLPAVQAQLLPDYEQTAVANIVDFDAQLGRAARRFQSDQRHRRRDRGPILRWWCETRCRNQSLT